MNTETTVASYAEIKARIDADTTFPPYQDYHCPQCGRGDELKTCETVLTDDPDNDTRYPAYSAIQGIEENGKIDFAGDTDYDDVPGDPCHDTCETVTNADGVPKLNCGSCGNEWYDSKVRL
jgi:hypothetical protein